MKLYEPDYKVPVNILYKCPICDQEYYTEHEAFQCLKQEYGTTMEDAEKLVNERITYGGYELLY